MSPDILDALGRLDSCTVSNAIERLEVRPRNEGFVHNTVRCRLPGLPPMVGYAVTARIRTLSQPIAGGWYYDHMDWWKYVSGAPEPRVIVAEDIDRETGAAAWFGEIHAAIARALGCVGFVTDGAVRDLGRVEAMRFPLFSGSVSVSHAYAHVVEFGQPVEIGRLRIHPGDLLHGDRHGVLTVPRVAAGRVPQIAAEILEQERRLVEFCGSAEFSLDALPERFSQLTHESTQ